MEPKAYRIHRDILCIDLKSFYASVECVRRGLDPFSTPLIVADESRGSGSIVLAVSPYLKQRGLPSRLRLYELPDDIEGLIVAPPRMRDYLKVSRDIVDVYLDTVAPEDLHVYSIDEAFLDLTPYRSYYRRSPWVLAEEILDEIRRRSGVPAACGIGENLLLSKLALDLKSKHRAEGIAEMRYEDVPQDLWPLQPLREMWGIGARLERRLNQLNLYRVGDVAAFDRSKLRRHFGIIGDELYFHAHGIDQSIISEPLPTGPSQRSVGVGQTLFSDHEPPEIFTVLLEMVDEVAERLRFLRREARTVHLHIGYSAAYGGGFSRQSSLAWPTDSEQSLMDSILGLFERFYEGLPIRRVSVRATNLARRRPFEQLSLFERSRRREQSLMRTISSLRERFGRKSVMRLSSYLEGTAYDRAELVGGHRG